MMEHTARQFDRNKRPSWSAGFTLIEILVAILVLSLGVLGLIGMESLALKNNHSAYQRTQATLLSYDLMDRIRANRGALDQYDDSVTPDSTSMAGKDVSEWEARLKEVLPGATNERKIVSGSSFSLTIIWADNREKIDPDTRFINVFRP